MSDSDHKDLSATSPSGSRESVAPVDYRPVAGFFGPDRSLFGVYHPPRGPRRDLNVLLCAPLGYEAMQSYRAWRLLAARLAARGFPVLRFDYHGTGESDGAFTDPGRVDAWLRSIDAAASALREITGTRRLAMVGLRMGAVLAGASVAAVDPSHLVFWEPSLGGARYTKELEFAAAAARGNASAATESAGSDGVQSSGFHFTDETLGDLRLLDAFVPSGPVPSVLVLHRDDRPARQYSPKVGEARVDVTVQATPGYSRMMIRPAMSAPPRKTYDQVAAWLTERSEEAGARESQAPAPHAPESVLHGERRTAGRLDRVVHIGPERRIFGVVTGPGHGRCLSRLLLLSGGAVPRTAVNGMYVVLARRLVDAGVSTLRMDVAGIGESEVGPGGVENEPYGPTLLDDVREAVVWMRGHVDGRGLTVAGLCSGAWAALRSALADDEVDRVALVNPIVFGASEGRALEAGRWGTTPSLAVERSSAAEDFERRFGPSLTRLARSAKRTLRALRAHWTAPARELRGDLRQLLTRGTRVAVIFSAGDDGEPVFHTRVGRFVHRRLAARLDLATFSPADHIFSESTVRDAMLNWLVSWLTPSENASERDRDRT